jgi:hypothetical protein
LSLSALRAGRTEPDVSHHAPTPDEMMNTNDIKIRVLIVVLMMRRSPPQAPKKAQRGVAWCGVAADPLTK